MRAASAPLPHLVPPPEAPGRGGTPGGGARAGVRRRGRDRSAGRSGRAHVGGAPRGAAAGSGGRDGAVTCAPGEAGRGEGRLWRRGGSGVRSRAVRSRDAGARGRVRCGAGPAPCRAARAAAAVGEPPPWAAAWGGSAGSGPPPGAPAKEQVSGAGDRGAPGRGAVRPAPGGVSVLSGAQPPPRSAAARFPGSAPGRSASPLRRGFPRSFPVRPVGAAPCRAPGASCAHPRRDTGVPRVPVPGFADRASPARRVPGASLWCP